MTDEQKISTINEILSKLHNPLNGFMGLRNSIKQQLSPQEIDSITNIQDALLYIQLFIVKQIIHSEKSGTQYNQQEFEKNILKEIRQILANPKEYKKTHNLDEYDKLRFTLDGETIMKYRFYSGCGNAASAFKYVNSTLNTPIPDKDIKFLHSTKWSNLSDGQIGHTVPCVRLSDGNWLMIEPQKHPKKGSFSKTINQDDFQVGKPIYHILSHSQQTQPYMITNISSENFYDFEKFLSTASRVSEKQAQEFISKIDKILIGKGAHSSVYINPNKPDIIIKQNNSVAKDFNYIQRQIDGYNIIERIKNSGYEIGVQLPTLIDTKQTDTEQIIIEKRINGKTFDNEGNTWHNLSQSQKNNIAHQMAKFLVAMHSSGDMRPADKSIKSMFEQSKLKTATDMINAFDGAMPKTLATKLLNAEKYLDSADLSDEIHVLTHSDLRVNNLMYDDKTEQLTVLDFELATQNNIYHDFIARASYSSMPWDYTQRVITKYNAIQNKKYPTKINPKKVQNMLLYAIIHEHARNMTPEQNKLFSDQEKEIFFKKLMIHITKLTGLKFSQDKTQEFTKGRKKINQLSTQQNYLRNSKIHN